MAEAQEAVAKPTETWFHKMDGHLVWKILGPEINSPFRSPIPDRVLIELANRAEALQRLFNIRCLCDGHEIMMIQNVQSPLIYTDHPCITTLTREQILAYLREVGVDRQLDAALEKCRIEIKEELKRREINIANSPSDEAKVKPKKIEKKTPESGFRVIRR